MMMTPLARMWSTLYIVRSHSSGLYGTDLCLSPCPLRYNAFLHATLLASKSAYRAIYTALAK